MIGIEVSDFLVVPEGPVRIMFSAKSIKFTVLQHLFGDDQDAARGQRS